MMRKSLSLILTTIFAVTCFFGVGSTSAGLFGPSKPKTEGIGPEALAATKDGKTLFIAYANSSQVAVLDVASGKVARSISVPASPLALTLSSDNSTLYVACATPSSTIAVVNVASGKVTAKLPAGHTASAVVLSPDGKTLYVCNRFNNNVSAIDLATGKEKCRVAVPREPVAAAVTLDGKWLLVANHIHSGRADVDYVASTVSVIDLAAGKVSKEIKLPNGSGLLRDIRVSPDGKYACVTHLLARFHLPTTQLERGWMNTNALTIIDLAKLEALNTVLLDNVDSGAANPWACAWSEDGKKICVTHAGTHEISVIDAVALLDKLLKMPTAVDPNAKVDYNAASRVASDVPNDLSFLVGLRQRIKLSGNGPRAVAMLGSKVYTANFFSDDLNVVDLGAQNVVASAINLGGKKTMSVVRRGEMLWNDGTICFQGWQSCSSCHSSDARTDGLNWDLLNDGIGNPKNSKSLLLSFQTPPTSWSGVRENANMSIRAGIQHILFAVRPVEEALALDEYTESLKAVPSPYLENGRLSKSAERGKALFYDKTVGCATCHTTALLTDMKEHDVGTVSQFDKPDDKFDTPSLVEMWRTAPYMHDGSAATAMDVLTTKNKTDQHGKTSHLNKQQLEDLVTYMLSL